MDFIQQLRVFVSVVDNGSFARAADALRMARPSVTNAIGRLESSVGARLLHRTTRRTSLDRRGRAAGMTGRRSFSRTSPIPGTCSGNGRHAARSPSRRYPGGLEPGRWSSPACPKFSRAYPDVDIVLGASDRPRRPPGRGIDCVLRLGDLPASSMISRVVAHLTMVLCASPGYLARPRHASIGGGSLIA